MAKGNRALLTADAVLSLINFVRSDGTLGDMTDAQIAEKWAAQSEESKSLRHSWEKSKEAIDPPTEGQEP